MKWKLLVRVEVRRQHGDFLKLVLHGPLQSGFLARPESLHEFRPASGNLGKRSPEPCYHYFLACKL